MITELDKTVKLTLLDGVEGGSVYLNDYRIAGPKPWGGGRIVKECNVVTFDKRRNRANPNKTHYRYGFFGPSVDESFGLVVAMHSDAGTDEALDWAIHRGVPFAVVPCCTRPSRWPYGGPTDQDSWIGHLVTQCRQMGASPSVDLLAIRGANRVLASLT